jgi:putative transposase
MYGRRTGLANGAPAGW